LCQRKGNQNAHTALRNRAPLKGGSSVSLGRTKDLIEGEDLQRNWESPTKNRKPGGCWTEQERGKGPKNTTGKLRRKRYREKVHEGSGTKARFKRLERHKVSKKARAAGVERIGGKSWINRIREDTMEKRQRGEKSREREKEKQERKETEHKFRRHTDLFVGG